MATLTPCARALTGHGPRDGLAVVDASVPRRPRGRHEEDEPKGGHGVTACIPSRAPISKEAPYVELSRVAVGGPRAVRPRVRGRVPTPSGPDPPTDLLAQGLEADVVGVPRPAP